MKDSDMGVENTLPVRRNVAVRWVLPLILILMIGVSVVAATQMLARVGRSDQTTRAELEPVVERYRALAAAGDRAALADWIDPAADSEWRESVLESPAAVAPPFASVRLGKIGTLDEDTDDIYQVELIGTIEQDGISVPAYAYMFFRRTDSQWLPTFPVAGERWGPQKSFDSNGVILRYRVEESQEILTAMSEVAALNRRLQTFDHSVSIPALTVEIDPVTPLHGVDVTREENGVTIQLRSASVGWGEIEPTTHLRAQYAQTLLNVLAPTDDAFVRAGRRALARYWVGQLNQAHPLFDTALIATARPMLQEKHWPDLVSVLSDDVALKDEERDAALTTAYLWLLSEGFDASDLHMLLEQRGESQALQATLTARLEMTPAQIESAWQEASRIRYSADTR